MTQITRHSRIKPARETQQNRTNHEHACYSDCRRGGLGALPGVLQGDTQVVAPGGHLDRDALAAGMFPADRYGRTNGQ